MYNPTTTYRLQFHKDFTFSDFERIISYLRDLGVKTVYASPVFTSVKGSVHGYDSVDPHAINPEIGTLAQLKRLRKRLAADGIGWLQDIVPNHMAFDPANTRLMDVLENGRQSAYATWFDTAIADELFEGKLMVPFLGDTVDSAIDNGELLIRSENDKYYFACYDALYPIAPRSVKRLKVDLADINADKSLLKTIAAEQEYRLCSWKETDGAINYRRFFTVNSLICLNMQNSEVFTGFHRFIDEQLRSGLFNGLRIDHVDGLYDPAGYLEQLRTLVGPEKYLTVEKILEPGEPLPERWPIQGTTGYDFLGLLNNLFTCRDHAARFRRFYSELNAAAADPEKAVFEKKRLILDRHMQGELTNLYRLLAGSGLLTAADLETAGAPALKAAIAELLVRMRQYRFYGNAFPLPKSERDALVALLKDNSRNANSKQAAAQRLLQKVLVTEPAKNDAAYNRRALHFYQRLMQFSGPLMAKGVEDTLMYADSRFVGHNEVGDSPSSFGISADDFHQAMLERREKWPLTMNATATHDTKRGEDVRARLNVLSGLGDRWFSAVSDWRKMNAGLKTGDAPDANDEYFIYQTLVGAWPMPGDRDSGLEKRLHEYLEKSLREAKIHSDWATPNEAYETAAKLFVTALLDEKNAFRSRFEAFHREVADLAVSNSLAQVLLKFTCPGVPDVYQGCEWWDFSLVDPDNRRPVDYQRLTQGLAEIAEGENQYDTLVKSLWQNRFDGKIKLWLTRALARDRKSRPGFYEHAEYLPLEIKGRRRKQFIAFARRWKNEWTITVAALFPGTSGNTDASRWWRADWKDTGIVLPAEAPAEWQDMLTRTAHKTGAILRISDLLRDLPVAFLQAGRPQNPRGAGILAAISSLPGDFGIGDLGPAAHRFAGFLARSQQKYWQVLPLGPTETGNGNSPYSSNSSMAGNTLLISPELLCRKGFLDEKELQRYRLPAENVDYRRAGVNKSRLFAIAWESYNVQYPSGDAAFTAFRTANADWLDDFALYTVLKRENGGAPWHAWPDPFKRRDKKALADFREAHADELLKTCWLQHVFTEQWGSLRTHCTNLGISMVGDLPFYVNYDSADVWANPGIFCLDENGAMTGVSGVPPDYFNEAGQLWGMPVFRWDVLKKQEYGWWIRRIRKNMQLYDLLRLDHFRAFSAYWEVPAGEETAINGTWKPGPGADLFRVIERELGGLPFIAEDLGDVEQDVFDLRDRLGLPGMKVLQFAWGDDRATSIFAPHNYSANFAVYTGTHDNNTTLGWLHGENPDALKRMSNYLGARVTERNVHEVMMRVAYASVAKIAMIPLQDILGLDERARMNTPATVTGNWSWRLADDKLGIYEERLLRNLVMTYNRA